MGKCFNVTGACDPQLHYMVDIKDRLAEINELVDDGAYFTINRARQYGKTTTLKALKKYLSNDYVVVSTDFQLLSHSNFKSEAAFVRAFSRELVVTITAGIAVPGEIKSQLQSLATDKQNDADLGELFSRLVIGVPSLKNLLF